MALKEKLIDKAQKLIQKGYLDKAIVEYRAAADADPRDISIRLRIGDLYVKLGKKNEAIKEYTEAAKSNAQRGFYLKAIAVYKQILKLDENIEIHNKLAELYLKQRLIADAIGEYSYIVHWYENRGKANEVLELLKKMAEIDPENVGIRLKLADLYQKQSFPKDALNEYAASFEKLMLAGKLDKAEKVFLAIYNSNQSEERVLKGLAELYRLKGDNAQRLRFLKGLFNYYTGESMADEARRAAQDIISISPADAQALKFLKKDEKSGPQVVTRVPSEPSEPLSMASSIEVPADFPEAAPSEEPIVPFPEEEIEITIEGFEETITPPESPKEAPPEKAVEEAPVIAAAPVEPHSMPTQAAPAASGEVEIELEDLLKGDLPSLETAEPQAEARQPEPPAAAVDVERAVAAIEETGAGEAQSADGPVEDAGIEEALSVISAELQEELEQAPVAGKPHWDEAPVQVPEPIIHVEEIMEALESVEAPEPATAAPVEAGQRVEARPEEPAPVEAHDSHEEAFEVIEVAEAVEEAASRRESADVEVIEIKEEPAVAAPSGQAVQAVEAPAEAAQEAAQEAEEELQEDLSSAIQELMEKMEEPAEEAAGPIEAPAEAAQASQASQEDYVDLSAELGMEEASKDIAGSWGGAESAETVDEFVNGIGKQLSKEDSETHYNLGIAYMEMELFSEASKEFKIALKDSRLELDCYTRLGLCAMSEGNPEEAAAYYTKGLKIAERSEDEKKALMYELALAHEAAGRDEEALALYTGIYAMDPEFREAALKVSSYAASRPMVPLDDGLLEIELL